MLAAQHLKQEVCLIDLGRPVSQSQVFINHQNTTSLEVIRPLLADEGVIPRRRLESAFALTPHNFFLAEGFHHFNGEAAYSPAEINTLTRSVRASYALSIFDVSSVVGKDDLATLASFDHILIVVSTETTSLAATASAIAYLKEREPESFKKCMFVINRADQNDKKTLWEVSERLGISFVGQVEDDPEAVQLHTARGTLFEDEKLVVTHNFQDLSRAVIDHLGV